MTYVILKAQSFQNFLATQNVPKCVWYKSAREKEMAICVALRDLNLTLDLMLLHEKWTDKTWMNTFLVIELLFVFWG